MASEEGGKSEPLHHPSALMPLTLQVQLFINTAFRDFLSEYHDNINTLEVIFRLFGEDELQKDGHALYRQNPISRTHRHHRKNLGIPFK